jgi:hypothetical protein
VLVSTPVVYNDVDLQTYTGLTNDRVSRTRARSVEVLLVAREERRSDRRHEPELSSSVTPINYA